jgi:hypothetical protein
VKRKDDEGERNSTLAMIHGMTMMVDPRSDGSITAAAAGELLILNPPAVLRRAAMRLAGQLRGTRYRGMTPQKPTGSLRSVIASLPPAHRLILVVRCTTDLDAARIAEGLGWKVEQVKAAWVEAVDRVMVSDLVRRSDVENYHV